MRAKKIDDVTLLTREIRSARENSDVWETGIHEGFRTKIIKMDCCTVEINRPILTEAERENAERRVVDALRLFGQHRMQQTV